MKKINVNDNGGNDNTDDLKYEYDLKYMLSTREGMVARELAEGLNDRKSIRYYFSMALEHSEQFLREIYRKVQQTPENNIRKSKGALFAYLIKKYEHLDTFD
jgi:hypothetical protein